MRVKVKLFSHIRYALDKEEITLDLEQNSTTADVENEIRTLGGDKVQSIPIRIAVNQEFILSPQKLNDNDEVALIPPVQGG